MWHLKDVEEDKKNHLTNYTFLLKKGPKKLIFTCFIDNTLLKSSTPDIIRAMVYAQIRRDPDAAFILKWARFILNTIAPLNTAAPASSKPVPGTLSSSSTAIPATISVAIAAIAKAAKEREEAEQTPTTPTKEEGKHRIEKSSEGGMVHYKLPPKESKIALSTIRRGNNLLIVGDSGCGKSRMIKELAKQEGTHVVRVNGTKGITTDSFTGTMRANKEGTYFDYGLLPKAMKAGHWLLVDEMDYLDPAYLTTLQAVLEGDGTPLVLTENAGELVHPHPNFRIIATANTLGRGDTNGYHGTNMMNIATLDRWSIIQMTYTEDEENLIAKIVDRTTARKMMEVATRVRKAIKSGELPDFVFSTRRLIKWAEALTSDLTFSEATEAEVIGRLVKEEREIISEVVFDSFGERV